jgi:hypothetical protein
MLDNILILERTITKDILKNKLSSGPEPAIEFLYVGYSSMLFGFLLQFVPVREEAEDLLVTIFSSLAHRLPEAFESDLSIYCWLQTEAREIILEYKGLNGDRPSFNSSYYSLLKDASPEHQWVFGELFMNGRKRAELVAQLSKEETYIEIILRESLLIIGEKLLT